MSISPDLTREDSGIPSNLDPITAKFGVDSPRKGVIYSIAPSPLDANLLWVGTDDGLIHRSTDDGKHWQNVTPSALTAWSKVATLEASHFDKQTAYAAVDRHRLEDYKAYLYRTHDGGKSWQAITQEFLMAHISTCVREDPAAKGTAVRRNGDRDLRQLRRRRSLAAVAAQSARRLSTRHQCAWRRSS